MATTFLEALPTVRDRARFRLGDTGTLLDANGAKVWLLWDETIDAMIATNGFSEGVAQLAEGLITRFAQEPDKYEEETGVKLEWTERIDAWQRLIDQLRGKAVSDTTQVVEGSRFAIGRPRNPDLSGLRFGR